MPRLVVRDDQWARIGSLMPGKPGDRGRSARNNRLFLEAVLWIARTGAPWRDLPPEFGNWNSVFVRFRRWARAGVWDRLLAAQQADLDREHLLMDSTIVRAHQHAAGAKGARTLRRLAALAAA
jgi:putative transposase